MSTLKNLKLLSKKIASSRKLAIQEGRMREVRKLNAMQELVRGEFAQAAANHQEAVRRRRGG